MFLTTIFAWFKRNKSNTGVYVIMVLAVILPVMFMLYKGVCSTYNHIFNIESSDSTIERLTINNSNLTHTLDAYKVTAAKKEAINTSNLDIVVKKVETDSNITTNVAHNEDVIDNNVVKVKHIKKVPAIKHKPKYVSATFVLPDNNESNYIVIDGTDAVSKEDYIEYGKENIDAIYSTYNNVKSID